MHGYTEPVIIMGFKDYPVRPGRREIILEPNNFDRLIS